VSADLFTVALGLQSPWKVADIRFEPAQGEIHFDLVCEGQRLICPACGAVDQRIHDRQERTWQHLHFFQYRAFLHARVPRVNCAGCGKVSQVPVPWARAGSGFTLLLEALVLTLAQKLPIRQIAALLGVGEKRVQQAITAHVEAARGQESYAAVRQVGVDEKHIGRLGFITLFHDVERRRVLFGTSGRDGQTFEAFREDLQGHGGDAESVEALTMDLSKAYQAGARKVFPKARLCFDGFHLAKLVHEALDRVRREEVKQEAELKGIRWGTLKTPQALDEGADGRYGLAARLGTEDRQGLAHERKVARNPSPGALWPAGRAAVQGLDFLGTAMPVSAVQDTGENFPRSLRRYSQCL
jgi:transposase